MLIGRKSLPKRFLPRKRGFTLVELLIAVAVLGILTALALPSFTQWIANTKIRSTTESILAGFQLARTEAVRRNGSVQVVLGTNTGWTVTHVASGDVIQTRPATEGSDKISLVITVGGAPVAAGGTGTVSFNGLGRVANATPITQVLVDSTAIAAASSRELQIRINAGGEARACDPSKAASDDPRGC